MATLFTIKSRSAKKKPSRAIDFRDPHPPHQKRRVLLGQVDRQTAETAKIHIERLISARAANTSIHTDTAAWLSGLAPELHARLVKAELAPERADVVARSQALAVRWDEYLDRRRPELKASSLNGLDQVRRGMVKFFGADRGISSITATDAKRWRAEMLETGLSEATVRRFTRGASQLFRDAVEDRVIDANPFAGLPKGPIAADRSRYVSRDDAARVLEALPDLQMRLLFALARFAGLRTPSETHALRWSGIDLEARRMTVYAPKLHRRAGGSRDKATRVVPITTDLLPFLVEAVAAHDPADDRVITLSKNNFSRRLRQAIEKSGVEPWEDLWQALRRAAETDFLDVAPLHVVAKTMGHAALVSANHYAQTNDAHLDRMAGVTQGVPEESPSQRPVEERSAKSAVPCRSQNETGRDSAGQPSDSQSSQTPKNKGLVASRRSKSQWRWADSNRRPRVYESLALTS